MQATRLIHLDTNVLIALPLWAQNAHPLVELIEASAATTVSAVVWYEFLCGPVSAQHRLLAAAILSNSVVPVSLAIAERASELFNAVGRVRRMRTDALIAASAIDAGAEFITINHADFTPFIPYGLQLLKA